DAILVGVGTILADDPWLTSRLGTLTGAAQGTEKHPHRIIVDTHLSTPLTARVVADTSKAKTTLFIGENVEQAKLSRFQDTGVDIQVVGYDAQGRVNLREVFSSLGAQDMISVRLEGGAEVNGTAVMEGLVDKVLVFIAPLIIGGKAARSPVEGEGITSLRDAIRITDLTTHRFGDDVLLEGYVNKD
ncbi:hypothetical protein GF339_10170, partial [candidate division KSB3 bacterium]|nr:hypothetical protein [candidate division KSB3 bacterium]MBD3324940.1 hypothetical protein [candidate division KSB3 bacterium]